MVIIENLQWVRVSKYRLGVLSALKASMKSPSELAKELNHDLPHVSRTLSQLSSKGYIVNNTPNLWKNKLFAITKKGKKVLREIKTMLG